MSPGVARAATLKDLARLAGVSVNTASLAIRQSPRLSEETRRRILQLARRHAYVPNSAARNLARNRSGMIGIYTRALHDAVRTDLVNRLFEELHTAEYRPLLGLGGGHAGPWHTSPWIRTFLELQVEAMVVVVEGVERLPRWPPGIPFILVGCQPRKTLRCDYLGLDRAEGARLGIEHLVSRGHRKVLVAAPRESLFGRGCLDALRAAGLRGRTVDVEPWREPGSLESLAEAVTRAPDRPTAAIFGDAPQAVRFMHRMEGLGCRIPDDLAVVSYDYFPWADMLRTPLTTVEQPIEAMALEAVKTIRARLAEPDHPPMQMVLQHRLVARKSA